jgi:sarcosine oxidase, subunit gamma
MTDLVLLKALRVRRLPRGPVLIVRLHKPDAGADGRLSEVFGTRLRRLSPVAWMVLGEASVASAAAAVAPALGHVAEVGEGRVAFEVSGAQARDLLATGTSLDLHERVFPPGSYAQTLFAGALVLIERPGAEAGFILQADISYETHLERWLEETALEFT